MLERIKKGKFILGAMVIAVLAIIIPITIGQVQKNQETRSRASGEAVSVILDPLTKNVTVGGPLGVEMKINGGQNNISAIDITITYDSSLLEGNLNPNSQNPIFLNNAIFTTILLDTNTLGTIHWVGVNPTVNAITGNSIDVAKLVFTAKATGTATVGFSNIHINASGVASALPIDTENTRSGTYTIGAAGTISPSLTPTNAPTGTGGQTSLDLSLRMTGIGSASSALGTNKNPTHPQRNAEVKLINAQSVVALSTNGNVTFDSISGLYKGTLPLGNIAAGPYVVKIRLDNTLWRQVAGIQNIAIGTLNQTPVTTLTQGDGNSDNELSLTDYNLMMSCLRGSTLCNSQ